MKLPPLMQRPDGQPVVTAEDRDLCRTAWLQTFADRVYGPIPEAPKRLDVRRERSGVGERLVIDATLAGQAFAVDAALWLPADQTGPVPIIIGLGFLGPIGAAEGAGFPIDNAAVIERSIADTLRGGRLAEANRGQHTDRWPIRSLLKAGYGVLLSCYGSWVADHRRKWRSARLGRAARSCAKTGALSLWAWAYQRLVDIACRLDEIDRDRVVLVGHSRLGKAALWAAANDQRVHAALINNSGCAGASLTRHPGGETLSKLIRFSHWTVLDKKTAADPAQLPVDQHQLIACLAPRKVYIASASEDAWADPEGEYLALKAAAPFWATDSLPPLEAVWRPGRRVWSGQLGWHLRPGPHDMTSWDWRRFLAFLAQDGRDANANHR